MSDIVTMWQESEPGYRERLYERIAREGAAAKPSVRRRLAVLVGVCAACFAPALAIAAGNGSLDWPEAPVVAVPEAPVVAVPEAPEAVPEAPERWAVPEVVVVAAAPKGTPRARSCVYQTTELGAPRTAVRVCDVPRTSNGKAGVWDPVAKPTRLASRDLPSPSGLLR